MNDVSAAIGLANIKHTERLLEVTAQHAKRYNDAFGIKPRYGYQSSYWLYTIHVRNSSNFIAYMRNNGVDCSKVHARNDTKTIFASSPKANLPGVDAFDKTHVCIPAGWWLTDDDVSKIIDLVRRYKNGSDNR
jgi:dTDP-4-amino-4,6-dideoxygalactose transaminase